MNKSWTTPIFDFANIWPHFSWTSTILKVSCMGTTYKKKPRAIDQQHPMDERTSMGICQVVNVSWTIYEQIMNTLWTRTSWTSGHIAPSISPCDCRPHLSVLLFSDICVLFPLPRAVFLSFVVSLFSFLVSHDPVGSWIIHEQFMNNLSTK